MHPNAFCGMPPIANRAGGRPAKAWGARSAVRALPDQEGTLSMIIRNALNVACLRGKSSRTEMHGEPTVAFFWRQDD